MSPDPTAPTQQYVYNAKVVNVVDGDTIDVVVDLGFRMTTLQRTRLADVDCPEVHGPTREAGLAAAAYTRERLLGRDVLIRTTKSDAFGRWLARVWLGGECFNRTLVEGGHAVPYREGEGGA